MSYEEKNVDDTHTLSEPEGSNESSLNEILRFALIALIIVLPIRWFVAQPFIVSGASMEDTFHNNEYLIVDQVTYRFDEPQRGDVIVFKYPRDHSKYFIKRIIGLPGETVIIDGAIITIKSDAYPEGLTLDEPYAQLGASHFDQTLTLGEDEYFVMGDNRDHSSDSRVWGVLKREEIVGRALLRLLPPGRADLMPGAVQ
jgi:signal peptidase I